MAFNKKNLVSALPLYVISSRQWLNGKPFTETIENLLSVGIGCLQIREDDLPFQHFKAMALPIKKLCLQYNLPLIIANNVEIALEIDADGIHIQNHSLSIAKARRAMGNKKIIGVSVKNLKQALQVQRAGADYISVDIPLVTENDFATLHEICNHISIPVITNNDLPITNIAKLKNSGVSGIALCSAIMSAPDIKTATNQAKKAVAQIIGSENKIQLRKINPQGFIFDMDGTLLNSLPAWYNLANNFLIKQKITPPENIGNIIEKLTLEDVAIYFADNFDLGMTDSQILDAWREEMAEQYTSNINIKPGVEEFLKLLQNKDIKCCVATLTERELAQMALDHLGLSKYIEFIITVKDVGQRKNNPKIYLKAAKKLGLEAQDCMVFEDALYAISSAKNAGFSVCGIIDEMTLSYQDKIKHICDITVESFEELL